jgi:hypothetical protein
VADVMTTDAPAASGPVDVDMTNQAGQIAAAPTVTASGPVTGGDAAGTAPDASGPDDTGTPMDPVILGWAGPDDGDSSPMDPIVLTWGSGPDDSGDQFIVDIGGGHAPAATGPVIDSGGDDGDGPLLVASGPTS